MKSESLIVVKNRIGQYITPNYTSKWPTCHSSEWITHKFETQIQIRRNYHLLWNVTQKPEYLWWSTQGGYEAGLRDLEAAPCGARTGSSGEERISSENHSKISSADSIFYFLEYFQDSETNEEESAYNEHFKHTELRPGTGVRPSHWNI